MEPFKANKLPIDYNMDKELLSLISEANEKYGEYKSILLVNLLRFWKGYFLVYKKIKNALDEKRIFKLDCGFYSEKKDYSELEFMIKKDCLLNS